MATELNPAPQTYTVIYINASGVQEQVNVVAIGTAGAESEFRKMFTSPQIKVKNIFRRS